MNASSPPTTIDPAEAAHFGRLAADWWDPAGTSAMLHKLNPARLGYLRRRIDAHWGSERASRRPLEGKRALDIGCGGGLLAEPLARLGATVTAIDAAPEAIAVARAHAQGQGLAIDYRTAAAESLAAAGERFDLVTSMEVIEHVADLPAFISALAALLAPGGLAVLSTPNRTARSRLALITLGEGLRLIPRGTHDWSKFITPDELGAALGAAGLKIDDLAGIAFSAARGFVLSTDMSVDYLASVTHG
jgi:2-polyprenyl-6-hydroxyphenyl methylase/3-demethylubiquinone-9 3-methyltransferase